MSANDYSDEGWQPQTRLGRKVQSGEIDSMEEAIDSGLPMKEPEIVSQLLPDLTDEVLDINMVQRMTDSGRRVKFRVAVAVGNHDGYIGYAEGRDDQVGGAIQKAIQVAKLNIIKVERGSGSWEDRSEEPHSLARYTKGKAGSVEVELKPAPLGLGLAAAEDVRKILELAGIEDAWTKSYGSTRTTMNLAKATFNALENSARARSGQQRAEVTE
ncbi:MAG: 30S ribosomal protein S5 [Halobacteriaceae archaeon]